MGKNKNLNSMSKQIVFILIFAFIGISAIAQTQSATAADPLLIPYRQGDKWGHCTKDKKVVIPCKYELTWNFSDGMALVMSNGKWGYIDKTGKLVVPCVYDNANKFSKGVALKQVKKLFPAYMMLLMISIMAPQTWC